MNEISGAQEHYCSAACSQQPENSTCGWYTFAGPVTIKKAQVLGKANFVEERPTRRWLLSKIERVSNRAAVRGAHFGRRRSIFH